MGGTFIADYMAGRFKQLEAGFGDYPGSGRDKSGPLVEIAGDIHPIAGKITAIGEELYVFGKASQGIGKLVNGSGTVGVGEGAANTQTGTVWDDIVSTADNIPNTKIPATFETKLNNRVDYINPKTGSNSLWTNANATEHMGEYISRFGGDTASVGVRSQIMLESYNEALNKAMLDILRKAPGRHFGTFGNWELGINTETGVVYHARMK